MRELKSSVKNRNARRWVPTIALLIVLSVVLTPGSKAAAAEVFSSFGPGDSFYINSYGYVGYDDEYDVTFELAYQFTVETTDYYLDSVDLAIKSVMAPSAATVIVTDDNGDEPGTILESVSFDAPDELSILTAGFSGTTLLANGESYWVWLSAPGAGNLVGWYHNNQDITGYQASDTDGGASWYVRERSFCAFRVTGTAADSTPSGDYNSDGVVDAADYTVWRDTLGSTSNLAADGNDSGAIDAGDYTVWKENYGSTMGGSGAVVMAAPEPGALCLLAIGGAVLLRRRWKSIPRRSRGLRGEYREHNRTAIQPPALPGDWGVRSAVVLSHDGTMG